MALKPIGYYCDSTVPFIEGIEEEYGSYLQKMSYELRLATRTAISSLIFLLERSDNGFTVRQLSEQTCSWVMPYLDIEDNNQLKGIMSTAIHLEREDMESFLYGLTAITQNSERE